MAGWSTIGPFHIQSFGYYGYMLGLKKQGEEKAFVYLFVSLGYAKFCLHDGPLQSIYQCGRYLVAH